MKVLGIGDVMCDKNLTNGMMYPGGQSLNIPANAILQGQQAAFMGCFGNDEVAAHIRHVMGELGIDFSHSRFYPVPHVSACYEVVDQERIFVPPPWKVHPMTRVLFNMFAYEGFTDSDWAYIRKFDVVHCSNDSRLEEFYPAFHQRGVCLSFDFSLTYRDAAYMEKICPNAYFVLLSCGDLTEAETRETLKRCAALGAKICIGTRGGSGSLCYDGQNFYAQEPVLREAVTDTMGAGDAFMSAFLVKFFLLDGKTAKNRGEVISQSMAYAADYAAQACQLEGSFGHGVPFR